MVNREADWYHARRRRNTSAPATIPSPIARKPRSVALMCHESFARYIGWVGWVLVSLDPLSDPSALSIASVRCVACLGDALLTDGQEFMCPCERSRAWCNAGGVQLLGPTVAWVRPGYGSISRRPVPPLL